jgi:hypothetical protein
MAGYFEGAVAGARVCGTFRRTVAVLHRGGVRRGTVLHGGVARRGVVLHGAELPPCVALADMDWLL